MIDPTPAPGARGPQTPSYGPESMTLVALYKSVEMIDQILEKAALTGDMARLVRIEDTLASRLHSSWVSDAGKAIDALKMPDKAEVKAADVEKVLDAVGKDLTSQFMKSSEAAHEVYVPELYKVSRETALRRAYDAEEPPLLNTPESQVKSVRKVEEITIHVRTDMVDERMISALTTYGAVWAGETYTREFSELLRSRVQAWMGEDGLGRIEAGKMLKEGLRRDLGVDPKAIAPPGWGGTRRKMDVYFRGLAANTATIGRVTGSLNSFVQAGVTRYTITAVMDRRTTPLCQQLNGKTFEVSQGVSQMTRELGAYSETDGVDAGAIRAAHPWPSGTDQRNIGGWLGGHGVTGVSADKDFTVSQREAAERAGLCFPPYHYLCRTTIDVDPSISFTDLVPPRAPASAANAPVGPHTFALPVSTGRSLSERGLGTVEPLNVVQARAAEQVLREMEKEFADELRSLKVAVTDAKRRGMKDAVYDPEKGVIILRRDVASDLGDGDKTAKSALEREARAHVEAIRERS